MVVTNVWPEHVRVHPGHPNAGGRGECLSRRERRGGPSGAEEVAEDRAFGAAVDGVLDGTGHCWWQRDQHDLAALASHAQDAVAVFPPRS